MGEPQTRGWEIISALAALALALPAGAAADTFCAPAPCSEGTASATIAAAIVAADTDPGADTVAITAGTHNLGEANLIVGDATTDVRGAGVDATILTADALPATAGFARTLISGYMSRLADLTLRLPSAVTSGNSTAEGADVYDGVVENVRVDALGASFGAGINDGSAQGLLVRHGSLRNVDVDLGVDTDSTGIGLGHIGGQGVTLEDVDATARFTMYSQPQADPGPVTMVARRLRLAGQVPLSVGDGFLELSDSVIDASSAPQQGEFTAVSVADGRPPSPAGLTLDRVTLIGNGGGESAALSVAGQGSPTPTLLRARHVTASGFGFTLSHGEFGGDAVARIDYSNLDLTPADIVDIGSGSGTGSLITDFGSSNRGGDPLLRDPAAGNFALLGGSPAIDIGGDDLLAGGPTDLAGDPRPRDGDGDGTATNDAGAFEFFDDQVAIEILGQKLKLNAGGRTRAKLLCPADEISSPCQGKLKLATRAKVRLGDAKPRKLTLDKARFEIPAGETERVELKLSGQETALVGENRKARRIRARAKVSDVSGNSATEKARLKLVPR